LVLVVILAFLYVHGWLKPAGDTAGGGDRVVRGWRLHRAERPESQVRVRLWYVDDSSVQGLYCAVSLAR
jgi:hypothetical protein